MQSRKVLVTGASSGIGLALAKRLLDEGHRVVALARRAMPLSHAALIAEQLDLSASESGQSLKRVLREHNDIDAVVSNAGEGQFGSLENFSASQIRESIDNNLTSHLLLARAALGVLKQQPRSDLVIVGSEAAISGAAQGTVYCAAKFGLRGFAQALRAESATANLHVGIVNPGMTRTPFFAALAFEPGADPDNALAVDDVVDAILAMLYAGDNAVIDEINLSPLKKVVKKK